MALVVRPPAGGDLGRALRGVGLTTGVPVIVLVAAGATPAQLRRLRPLLQKVVIPVAVATGAAVVDEGHAGGVGAMLGEASCRRKASFPLVGVAPERGRPGDDAASSEGLDPGHSHFVVVPADRPGWAAAWTSSVASALAGGNRSVALVTSGGDAAWASVAEHAKAGRPVVAVARTGGVADHLAAALKGNAADLRATPLAASGHVYVVDPARGAAHVADLLRSALSRPDALGPGPQT